VEAKTQSLAPIGRKGGLQSTFGGKVIFGSRRKRFVSGRKGAGEESAGQTANAGQYQTRYHPGKEGWRPDLQQSLRGKTIGGGRVKKKKKKKKKN